MALTATATPVVRSDIVKSLAMQHNHRVFTTSFFRDNLTLRVSQSSGLGVSCYYLNFTTLTAA